MTTWGLVATVKAPEEQLLAFVAHHLALGAERLWIYFDDPEDPAYARVAKLPRVTAVRCTLWYWVLRGGRPLRHQNRQIVNAAHAQRHCRLDWLGHIDVDEFLHAPGSVSDILDTVPGEVPNLLMEPFEAMHDPDLPDDIFTARQFRGPLHRQYQPLQPAILEAAAPLLAKGTLGHGLGKSFCRMGIRGVVLHHHLVQVNGKRLPPATFHPTLRLLHFHAEDPVAWRRALPFRLAQGAYHHPIERPLQTWLSQADDQALTDFYRVTMTLTPEKAALLQQHDRLITTDLALRQKVERLLAGEFG